MMTLYQIEVADFKKRDHHPRETRFHTSLVEFNTDQKRKLVDVAVNPVLHRTLLRWAKDNKSAKRLGEKVGTVLSCFKVDRYPYLQNIEHIQLEEKPLFVEVKEEEFTLNGDLEINLGENNIQVNIDK